MTQKILHHTFENGLTLLAEPNQSLESAAFTMLIPAGSVYDPPQRSGLAMLTSNLALRGAGLRDSREIVQTLDGLGVERGEGVSSSHISYSGATLANNLLPALQVYSDIVRSPHLPVTELEAVRGIALQELQSIEDEPAQKVMLELRARQYPDAWGRSSHGQQGHLEAANLAEIGGFHAGCFRPHGTIIGLAGRLDWPQVLDYVGQLFGDWKTEAVLPEPPAELRFPQVAQLPHESQQTQIGISYDTVPYRDPDYFEAWAGVGVLSGGMSSRLFTEVREKRGLCYSVYASYHTLRDRGAVLCYAGTSADRAQQTLDVTLQELRRLQEGITESELHRLKARIKSSLIMQQESSSSRSSAIARDWYHLGRVRTLDELGERIDGLSCESINRYLAARPPHDFTIVTLGSAPLEVDS